MKIKVADPLIPLGFMLTVPNPPTDMDPDSVFLASSASTLIFGCNNKNTGKREIWWRIGDVDCLGYIPFFRGWIPAKTEWTRFPDLPSDTDQWAIGGQKLLNMGENVKDYHIWLRDAEGNPHCYHIELEKDQTWTTLL